VHTCSSRQPCNRSVRAIRCSAALPAASTASAAAVVAAAAAAPPPLVTSAPPSPPVIRGAIANLVSVAARAPSARAALAWTLSTSRMASRAQWASALTSPSHDDDDIIIGGVLLLPPPPPPAAAAADCWLTAAAAAAAAGARRLVVASSSSEMQRLAMAHESCTLASADSYWRAVHALPEARRPNTRT
jgi:hypothetical protein